MIVTEAALRSQVRPPRVGATVRVPPGATLSPAASDFAAHWQLRLQESADLAPSRGRATARGARAESAGSTARGAPDSPGGMTARGTPNASGGARARGRAVEADRSRAADGGLSTEGGRHPSWDTPSRFPVVLEGDVPRCVTCHGEVRRKPDHLTQLSAHYFAPKTHGRIRLRGRVDSLQALALLVASRARAAGDEELVARLSTVAAYCRELMSAEYHERPAAAPVLDGLDEEEIHAATHDPDTRFGLPHLTPGVADPELLHWLNVLRCQVREVEVLALEVLPGDGWERSVVHGLNRLSSVVYYLELELTAREAR